MMTHDPQHDDAPLWVFGYGSLVWNPGFPFTEQVLASLSGFQRSFCMWSIHHRGSVEDPGLVLALDAQQDSLCEGVAFCVSPAERAEALAGLRERELVSSAYLETWLPVKLADGRVQTAVTYVVDPEHVQYTGALSLDKQAEVIAKAIGGRGPNHEYLANTTQHLKELGLHDPELDWLMARVAKLRAQ